MSDLQTRNTQYKDDTPALSTLSFFEDYKQNNTQIEDGFLSLLSHQLHQIGTQENIKQ